MCERIIFLVVDVAVAVATLFLILYISLLFCFLFQCLFNPESYVLMPKIKLRHCDLGCRDFN